MKIPRWQPPRGLPVTAGVIALLALIAAAFAPWIAPHDPAAPALSVRNLPPAFLDGGDPVYLLGTDRQGRDILTRVIYGAQISMAVAAITVAISALIGVPLGLIAGYFGGRLDNVIMAVVDISLSFPTVLVALVFAATVGPSLAAVVVIIVLMAWSRYARLVRGEVLSLRERDFVALARVAGASHLRILARHLLPNLVNSIIVLSTLQVGWAIVTEGFLSFLGAGVPPPTPTWGGMIAEGRDHLTTSWWIVVAPGLAIMAVVLSFNLVGDWLRDALDPRLRQI